MSNKLTNEKLKELIKEVLQEGRIKLNVPFEDFKSNPGGNFNVTSGGLRKKVGFKVGSGDLKAANEKLKFDLQNISKDNLKTLLLNLPKSVKREDNEATKAFYKPAKADPPPPPIKTDPVVDPVAKADTVKKVTPPPPPPAKKIPDPNDPIGGYKIPLGDPEKDKSGNPKTDYDLVLSILRDSFSELEAIEIKTLAGLAEGKNYLREDVSKDALDIEDIEALFGLDPIDVDASGATKDKAFSGTDETILSMAQKVEKGISRYIQKFIATPPKNLTPQQVKQKLRSLNKSKNKFNNLVAKTRKLRPGDSGGFLPFSQPTATQVNQMKVDKGSFQKQRIDPVTVRIFEDFFAGASSTRERVQRIGELSKKFKSAGQQDLSLSDMTNGAAIINMISVATRTQDPSAAGFNMEAMLAMIVAGEKIGHDNSYGDFIDGNGKQLSAKWLKSDSYVTQSSFVSAGRLLADGKELELIYVIGSKRLQDPSAGTSDPLGIVGVDIGLVKYIIYNREGYAYVEAEDMDGNSYTFTSGKRLEPPKDEDGKSTADRYDPTKNELLGDDSLPIPLGGRFARAIDRTVAPSTATSAGHIVSKIRDQDKYYVEFVTDRSKTFEQTYMDQLSKVKDTTVAGATKSLTSLYSNLKSVIDESNEFVNQTGKDTRASSGFAMADNFVSAKTHLKDLIRLLLSEDELKQIQNISELTENKTKSLKDLDKLIERVILESMNK